MRVLNLIKKFLEEESEEIKNYNVADYDKYVELFKQTKENVIKNTNNKNNDMINAIDKI